MITPADIRRSRDMNPAVRTCAASVCRAAVSQRIGVTSSRAIDKKTGAWAGRDADKRLGTSNRAAGWSKGHLPSDEAVVLIKDACGVDLREWRDLPLWKLLNPDAPSYDFLLGVFRSHAARLPQPVRLATRDETALRQSLLEHYDYLELRTEISLDRLTVLVALARACEKHGDAAAHAVASLCVFDLLPQVIRTNSPLQAAASTLFALCRDTMWSKIELAGVVIDLSESAFCRLQQRKPPEPDVHRVGAADIYQVHARLIRRARLYGQPAGCLERSNVAKLNPFRPSDPLHWSWTTFHARFMYNLSGIDPCPETADALLNYSLIEMDPCVMTEP